MAFSNQYKLNVDLKRRLSSGIPTFKQGDSATLRFKIYDDGKEFDLTDYTYSEITFRLPSGESLVGNPELVGNELVYHFTRAEMAEAGKVITVLSIMSRNTMVSIQPFTCFIFDSMKNENLSYIGILQELIKEVEEQKLSIEPLLNQLIETLELAQEDADELRNLLNQAQADENTRNNNESQRIANENVRMTNESNREDNEDSRILNENTRQSNEVNRTSTFNNQMSTVTNKLDEMTNLIDELESFDYSPSDIYDYPNLVTYNGSTYIALKEVANVIPTDDKVNYRLIAQRGVDGNGAVASVNGMLPDLNGNVEIEITDGVEEHINNVTSQKHIEVVTTIPTDLSRAGVLFKVEDSLIDAPDTPTIVDIQTELDNLEITKANKTTVTSLQNMVTQHLEQEASLTAKGHVQLEDNEESNSTTKAATINAVRKVKNTIGKLSELTTNNKSSLIGAINELNDKKDNKPAIYGVKIDTTNSNPLTSVTYTDDATGFTPARGNDGSFDYGSWFGKFPFNQIRPCVLKQDKTVNFYLNPDNYNQKLDGTVADITSGSSGDVMIEFPKVWWKIERIGTDLYVRYSDSQIDNTWKCLAHTKGGEEKERVYLSAYLGYEAGGRLRSLSGKIPTVNKTIGAFRTAAQANGSGYTQASYYQILMLQVLFLVMFKSRDSQTALGRGFVDGNSAPTTTGGANTKGLFYGERTGKQQSKFCGIEDFWGNLVYWVDGLYSDENHNILIATVNFNDTGSDYTNYGVGASTDIAGYVGGVQGGTETGFIVKSIGGSATTHWTDYGSIYPSRLASFGGHYSNANSAGAFQLNISSATVHAYDNFGARLLVL